MKNYANLLKKMIILLLVFSNGVLFAQFTRQQAIQKVLNEIVVADTGHIDVYSTYELKYYNDSILLAFDTTLLCPFNYNWVFFVNDDPKANWAHSCRYIFIDSLTGNYQTVNQYQYPTCFDSPACNDYELVSQIATYSPVQLSPNVEYNGGGAAPNEDLFAVIIITQDAENIPYFPGNRFWFDASLIYNTLKNVYGFTDQNIYVHYDRDGISDDGGDFENLQTFPPTNNIDYAATKLSISETFNNLSGLINTIYEIPALNESQQLFVFIDGHGIKKYENSSLILKNMDNTNDYFYDYELADLVEEINCAQMTFLIQPCYSGKFADELTDYTNRDVACMNRVVHTATSLDLVSKTEFNLTQKKYCEFTYYWTAAARGYYPVTSEPWTLSQYAVGEFPFDDLYPFSHPDDYYPDLNSDGFVQMEEAFLYANNFDSWSEYGYYVLAQGENNKELPQNYNEMGVEHLTTLKGLAGHIDNDQEIMTNRSYVVGDVITVLDNNDFYIYDNAIINCIGENAKFIVNEGGIMATEFNVSITGGEVIANGELIIGNNTTFTDCDISINGLEDLDIGVQTVFNDLEFNLNNRILNTDITYSTFNQCILTNYGQTLDITNTVFNNNEIEQEPKFYNYGQSLNISTTDFNNCYMLYSQYGNINVNQSTFNNTWLFLENIKVSNNTDYVAVNNCSFIKDNYPPTIAGIVVEHYGNYSITNNTFDGLYNGVQLWYSGESIVSYQTISDNEFKNSTEAGIVSFNSYATIVNNYIHDNHIGIYLGNESSIDLSGNQSAQSWPETQQIINNDSYEINIMDGCFPWNMHYNVIVDEDNLGNPNDPMVYYSENSVGGTLLKDVRFNCWGNNFSATEDLYPIGYVVDPTWCPGQLKSSLIITDSAETLYLLARDQFTAENYSLAKSSYISVVTQYPVTKYASAAMKDLFSLEKFESNNYNALKQYYETDTVIQSDTILQGLSVFLANKCHIRLENWQIAIDHYESIIEAPDNTEDSICAIIDLGDLYFLMANSASRVQIQGKLLEHIPTSKAGFFEKRDYLLSLLPIKETDKEEKNEEGLLQNGKLFQNMPNPFSTSTTVKFELLEQGEVNFRVFGLAGKTLRNISLSKPAGIHKLVITTDNLPNGVYFYSMSINGKQVGVKKMVILK